MGCYNLGSLVRVLGGKITGPKEIRPVWDNIARVNHQNNFTDPHPKRNFFPAAVLTKSGQVPVNAAKQSSHRAATSISAARRVNSAASRPNVNNALPITYSYFKAHSPVRRPFNQKTAAKTNHFNEKVNTAKIQALVDKKKVIITEASIRKDLRFEDEGGVDYLSNEVIFEQLTLMGYEKLSQKLTFYKAFFLPQWKFPIHTILQFLSAKTTVWNEFSSTMASAIICLATNQKFNFSKYIFDNMVKHLDGGVNFLMYSRFVQVFLDNQVEGMDRHNAIFVISSHTKKVFANMKRERKDLSGKVLNLEEAKTAQAKEIASLKKKVKKLEQKKKSRTLGLKILRKIGSTKRVKSSTEASLGDQEDASKQGRMIDNIDQDIEITLVNDTQGRMNEVDMFGVNDLDGDEVVVDVSASEKVEQSVKVVKKEDSTADPVTTAAKPKGITTAAKIVTAAGIRPKEKGIVMQEPSETPLPKPIISSQKPSQAKDKGNGKMVEPGRPLKIKDQIMMDAEVAKNLKAQMQAKLEEEERLARLKEEETNIALREELSIEEKSRLFVELMDKRKKHFARLRAKKVRSKPPTKAQNINQMCTYLKNMANYKHNQLKNKSFKEIQMLFNNTMKWIEAFIAMDTEKTTEGSNKAVEGTDKAKEGSFKRATYNLEQEDAKRKRIEEENETAKLKRYLEIIPKDDDVTIKATPLSSKSPTIVDYKIYKEKRKSFSKSSEQMCHLPGSGFTFFLAVETFFTGSGKLFCQWELYNWQWESLVHFIPNNPPLNLMLQLQSSF
uniref:Synaptobrevin, longin-like domain protein n=1 Tax=Tanacetum cinerariifolium TaxID=118510 RepID=A0A699HHQ0_TANCI|nr:hypothetical protein [Tanacetum cinerariifolium]